MLMKDQDSKRVELNLIEVLLPRVESNRNLRAWRKCVSCSRLLGPVGQGPTLAFLSFISTRCLPDGDVFFLKDLPALE